MERKSQDEIYKNQGSYQGSNEDPLNQNVEE